MRSGFRLVMGTCVAVSMLLASGLIGPGQRARADGFIVVHRPRPDEVRIMPHPRPVPRTVYMPLQVKYHRVDAEINDNAAVTKIDQVFYNPNNRQMEGTYMFPLPDDVAVQRFSMFMNGKEVKGELLDKDKARKIYEDIVRKMKDPALLEYVGTRMYKARVFPIPARGEVRIKLDYAQVVPVSAGLATYRYPLNTEKFSSAPLGEVAVRVRISSKIPLTTVFCPSHEASVDRKGKREAVVGYEAHNVLPDKDFIVSYQAKDDEFGLALLMHREAGEDGYFMARIAPGSKIEETKAMPKDICFVIDTSGSMSGKKIEQARAALRFCLEHLNEHDRFNVVAFSTEARPYRTSLIPASENNLEAAETYVGKLEAIGGTAINDALLAAMEAGKSKESTKKKDDAKIKTSRPYMVVFLTDGIPTVGETDADRILRNVKDANPGRVRLFVFGVGNDVNTRLLDGLAEENHGAREYVAEEEDLELKLSGFYGMIAHPVLSDVELDLEEADAYDVYPKVLPDLFKGTELVVFGRYKATGRRSIGLRGQRGEGSTKFTWNEKFAKRETGHDYLPRLWASRKIGYLLDQIRMHGEDQELKDEVVRLAKRHGILTPYTSFLVVEDAETRLASRRPVNRRFAYDALRQSADEGRTRSARDGFYSRSGEEAVAASKALGKMRGTPAPAAVEAEVADYMGMGGYGMRGGVSGPPGKGGAKAPALTYVGSRTFYRDGEKWIDSRYDGHAKTTKVKLFSDEYFDLVSRHPESSKCFALGPQIIVMLDGKAYETVED